MLARLIGHALHPGPRGLSRLLVRHDLERQARGLRQDLLPARPFEIIEIVEGEGDRGAADADAVMLEKDDVGMRIFLLSLPPASIMSAVACGQCTCRMAAWLGLARWPAMWMLRAEASTSPHPSTMPPSPSISRRSSGRISAQWTP